MQISSPVYFCSLWDGLGTVPTTFSSFRALPASRCCWGAADFSSSPVESTHDPRIRQAQPAWRCFGVKVICMGETLGARGRAYRSQNL